MSIEREQFHAPSRRLPAHVCIFAGSSDGADPEYFAAAALLGQLFAQHSIALVYGGGSNGIMGRIAWEVHSKGGSVTGIIPNALAAISGETIGTQVLVTDMHQRKQTMNRRAEAFVVLPGGYGTMEELVEMITWSQLNIHSKPIVLLNTRGFWDPFVALIAAATKEQFVSVANQSIFVVVNTPEEVIDALREYRAPKRAYELVWHHGEQAHLG